MHNCYPNCTCSSRDTGFLVHDEWYDDGIVKCYVLVCDVCGARGHTQVVCRRPWPVSYRDQRAIGQTPPVQQTVSCPQSKVQ
jgi:hypothetical protein